MSLIVTVHVQEGIVMASDSRLTIDRTRTENQKIVIDRGISQSDTNNKIFLAANNFGISMFGQATINSIPISGFVESFINENIIENKTDIDDVPQLLVDYFRRMNPVPDTGFHVAGYKMIENKKVQKVWRVFIINGNKIEIVPTQQQQGAIWDGEQDILTRLINLNVYFSSDKLNYSLLPAYGIPFEMFTLQDSIDFAVYAIKTTADTMRFQMRYKTVGGQIDVLVIKQNECFWIKRKSLYVT